MLILLAVLSSPQRTCDTITTLLQQNPERPVAVALIGSQEQEAELGACPPAGAIGFLAKPIDPTELDGLLEDLPDACKAGSSRSEDAAG